MKKEHFTYHSNDHVTEIHAIRWIPEGKVRAVLQISHGMVEFIDRYDEFAGYLAERGILVTGNDHLGHGKSVQSEEHYGYFAKEDGNKTLLKDIHRLGRNGAHHGEGKGSRLELPQFSGGCNGVRRLQPEIWKVKRQGMAEPERGKREYIYEGKALQLPLHLKRILQFVLQHLYTEL